MKRFFITACALAVAWGAMAGNDLRLWYNTPANNWNDALPFGNGRIATMVYGNPQNEEYQLNEETISKGSPYDNYNPEALQYLDEVRKLVFAGMSDSAQKVCDAHFISTKELGRGGAYQTAGSLHIDYTDHKNPINLCRELNISNATSLVSYKVKGVTYKEEAFTSLADQLLVIRLSASKKGKLNFDASFSYPDNLANISAKGNTLTMNGTTQDAAPAVPGGVNYLVKANLQNTDGKITTKGTSLSVRGATSV
ncbi:MAG: glycoside hydrolase family 95 protein, partial [Prevotella sp.]|nr:glycoside hydrolase family 95 protein [Prevotella sp.]